ncbi:MAG: cytochrome P460 family protein [Nitrosomonas sp.]|nr:cytochrome P460 family protein [Nitrosomonas sp.]
MKTVLKIAAAVLAISPLVAHSGGNPEHVKFPAGYENTFTKYSTANRANQTQVAKLYANDTAIASYKADQKAASGSVVVMEIYSTKTGEDGKPIAGSDGLLEIDSLAAVAVMENRGDWDAGFSADDRTGNWGFAVYEPDGSEKSNDLNCVQCHTPLSGQDYLFTYERLVDFVKNH